MEKELDKGYKMVLKNPVDGKNWEDVKANFLNR